MAEKNGKPEFLVGADLGGTKILAGVFNPSLGLRGKAKISAKPQRGVDAVIQRIARCVRDAVDETDLAMKQIRGIGLGVPGSVEHETGNIIFAPPFDWRDVPLKKRLEKDLGLPVFVDNDGNLAALGVYATELKSKPKHMLGIFIGGRIGGGLIINGELYRGFGHTAGEVGHMIIDLNRPKSGCRQKGTLEALASRAAIFQRIRSAVKDGQKTVLTEMLDPNLGEMRSGDLRKAIRRGDKLVQSVVEEAAQCVGVAVANLASLFNPEVIVLGGGVIEALADEMLGTIIETARDCGLPGAMNNVEILASNLGDTATITGAAVLAQRMTTSSK